jgi:hypothetical protein
MSITNQLLKSEVDRLPSKLCKNVKATDDGKKFSLLMLKKLSGYKTHKLKDYYTEGGGDHQVDGVYFSENLDIMEIHIITCKFPSNGSKFDDQDVTDFLQVGVKYLLFGEENAADLNPTIRAVRDEIQELMTEHQNKVIFSLKFICSSDEVLSSNAKGALNIFLTGLQRNGYEIDFEEYNLKRLSAIFSKRTVLMQSIPIKLSGKSYYPLVGREGFVCRLPVSELVKVYDGFEEGGIRYEGYGDYLFTDNVRKDIGLDKDKNINLGIYKTAKVRRFVCSSIIFLL